MPSITSSTLPAPEILKADVECFRLFEYTGHESLSIKVSPLAVPGIVFQHKNSESAIENLTTHSGVITSIPIAFIYGPGTKPSVMNYKSGPLSTVQVIFKPHALKALLGINASTLTDGMIELNEFAGKDFTSQLLEAGSNQKRVGLLTDFLIDQHQLRKTRDMLVEESLQFIHQNIASVTKKDLLDHFAISERQFERRFIQTVGITPQAYIRVKRFNEAIRLMKTREFETLTDVAHALNFYDQSHFIHDLKEFSGITPKSIFQRVEDFHDQGGFSYI